MKFIRVRLCAGCIAMILFVGQLVAQNLNFAPIGAKWSYLHRSTYGNEFWHEYYEAVGDTMIAGKTCRVIKGDYKEAYLYINNGVVERYYDGAFYTLFDFTKNEGEFWYSKIPEIDIDFKMEVDSVKYIVLQENITSKRQYVSVKDTTCNGFDNPFIIYFIDEKLACAHDFFPIYECAYDFSVPRIHCYSDDEVSVSLPGVFNTNFSCDYTNVGVFSPIQAEIITLYPTILSENTLYCNNQSAEKGTLSLQNLQGELLFSQQIFVGNNAVPLNPLPQGIYFATFQSASYLYTMKIMLM